MSISYSSLANKRGFTSILLLVVLFSIFFLGFIFTGAMQAKNAQEAMRLGIRQNLIFVARNIASSVDCETTTGAAPVNVATDPNDSPACAAWASQPGTGLPGTVPGHPLITVFQYPRNGTPSTNQLTDPANPLGIIYPGATFDPVLGVTPYVRARCLNEPGNPGSGHIVVVEVQLRDINNNVSPWNFTFRNRDGWIDIFRNVDSVANPFISKPSCQF
jgi:hypothetical protein